MLRDVIGVFLDTATEREFDGPLMALLAAKGFSDIHFLHGAFEFGKDFIAKGRKSIYSDVGQGSPAEWALHQFAIQSKAGDLNLSAWQAVRQQLDSARLTTLSHPSFDASLTRCGVLITTGRLRGAAGLEAQDYRRQEQASGRPDIEVWDRERLLEWLVDSPDAALAGGTVGPLLVVVGAIETGSVDLQMIEKFTRSWLPPAQGTTDAALLTKEERRAQEMRALVEGAVIVNRLRIANRLDLAAFAALAVLRMAWCHAIFDNDGSVDSLSRTDTGNAAVRLFLAIADDLHRQVATIADRPREFLDAICLHPIAPAAYPVACCRLAEILGLRSLWYQVSAPEPDQDPSTISSLETVRQLLNHQPGCAHPISDNFAVSLIAPTICLAAASPADAIDYLTRVTTWLADRHDPDYGGIGLAAAGSDIGDELRQLLGAPYVGSPNDRNGSYIATVILDILVATELDNSFYLVALNDMKAVGIRPEFRLADESVAHWRPDGREVNFYPFVAYPDALPADDRLAGPHHAHTQGIPHWDSVALSSIVRDRHNFIAMSSLFADARAFAANRIGKEEVERSV